MIVFTAMTFLNAVSHVFLDGDAGDNQHGSNPKAEAA